MKNMLIKLRKNVSSHDITSYSAQCAYYLLLSFFPFLIIIIMVLTNMGYEYINSIVNSFSKLPPQIIDLLKDYFSYSGNFSSLEFSPFIITILLMSSKAMGSLIKALNIVNDIKDSRNYFFKKFISVTSIIIVVLMIVLSIFISLMNLNPSVKGILNFLILMASISILYYLLPNTKRRVVEVLPGSFLASILLIITVYSFGYVIINFTKYSAIYGSMSSIIFLMIFLFLFAFIIIIGEELNVLLRKEEI